MKIKSNYHIIGDDDEQFNRKRLRYGQYYFDDGTQCPNEIEAEDENPDYNAVWNISVRKFGSRNCSFTQGEDIKYYELSYTTLTNPIKTSV